MVEFHLAIVVTMNIMIKLSFAHNSSLKRLIWYQSLFTIHSEYLRLTDFSLVRIRCLLEQSYCVAVLVDSKKVLRFLTNQGGLAFENLVHKVERWCESVICDIKFIVVQFEIEKELNSFMSYPLVKDSIPIANINLVINFGLVEWEVSFTFIDNLISFFFVCSQIDFFRSDSYIFKLQIWDRDSRAK
jgi:hypothetical protein